MKTVNKLLVASTMVVALGAAASCNKNNTVTGIPYTIISFSYLDLPEPEDEGEESVTFKFKCTGGDDIKFYWGTTEASAESSHTFTTEPENHSIVIEGNVTSISACDEKGTPLADGNNYIESIVFSNTITSIPNKAFLIGNLNHFYLPASVKSIGDYAFAVSEADPMQYICEPTSRPGGWSKTWCTFPVAEISITWGLGFYIDNDEYGSIYLISNLNQMYEAYYGGAFKCAISEKEGIKELSIPSSVKIDGRDYNVSGILGVDGSTMDTLTTVTIPASVQNIAYVAFEDCDELTTVNFAKNSQLILIDRYAFSYCPKLLNVSIPEGVEILSTQCFYGKKEGRFNLTIPNTVKIVGNEVVGDWDKTVEAVIDITSIKRVEDIPVCLDSPFDWTKKVTFKHDASIQVSEFVKKNWPKHDGTKYIWDPAQVTSLS